MFQHTFLREQWSGTGPEQCPYFYLLLRSSDLYISILYFYVFTEDQSTITILFLFHSDISKQSPVNSTWRPASMIMNSVLIADYFKLRSRAVELYLCCRSFWTPCISTSLVSTWSMSAQRQKTFLRQRTTGHSASRSVNSWPSQLIRTIGWVALILSHVSVLNPEI